MLWNGLDFARLQQAYDSTQVLPRRLIQLWAGADQIADHIPRRNVQRALGRESQRQ